MGAYFAPIKFAVYIYFHSPNVSTFKSAPSNSGLSTLLKIGPLKILWEKKKMLVTSIFFFFHNVFLASLGHIFTFEPFVIGSTAPVLNSDDSKRNVIWKIAEFDTLKLALGLSPC